MKCTKVIIIATLLLMVGLLSTVVAQDELEFSGDITGVSTYIWRGVKQFDGTALQGTVSGSYKALSFGVWYSSVNFGPETPLVETDPFVELSLPSGIVESSVGATIYTYDFDEYADGVSIEYELFGKVGCKAFGLAAYFVPSQKSTEDNLNESLYWIEASAGTSLLNVDWGLVFGYGTYSSRFLATPKKDATNALGISASKSLSDALSVSWNYSIATDSDMDNNLWVGIGYSF